MMTGIVERELQRTVWRRYRDTLCLVDASDPRFGAAGLAERVHEPSMRMLVLPADPERNLIAFDEEFWSRFMHGYQDPISGTDAAWGSDARPTWSAACRVDDWNDGWRRALAIHRSGAIEVLVGRGVAWERGDRRVFSLVGIVGYVWNTLAAWLAFRVARCGASLGGQCCPRGHRERAPRRVRTGMARSGRPDGTGFPLS